MPMFFQKEQVFCFFETLYLFILLLQPIGLLLPLGKEKMQNFLINK